MTALTPSSQEDMLQKSTNYSDKVYLLSLAIVIKELLYSRPINRNRGNIYQIKKIGENFMDNAELGVIATIAFIIVNFLLLFLVFINKSRNVPYGIFSILIFLWISIPIISLLGLSEIIKIKNSLASIKRPEIGITLSIIGLWLTGPSLIGRKNLEKIGQLINDGAIQDLFKKGIDFDYLKSSAFVVYIGIFDIVAIIIIGIIAFIGNTTSITRLIAGTLIFLIPISIVLLICLALMPFLMGILSFFLIIIFIMPYRLIYQIDHSASFERTILLFGIILGTLGLFFNY